MISYEELDTRGLLRRFVNGRFVPTRANAIGVADYATRSPRELLGESLLMAIAGRRGVAHELSGPGQPKLAARTGD